MQVPAQTRFVACLLGGALGDALGYPIEFERPGDAIVARFGSSAPARLEYSDSAGLISDDTQMTLFTAEALIEARSGADPTPLLLKAYQRWFATQAMRPPGSPFRAPEGHGSLLSDARLHVRRAPGNTCLSALARATCAASRPASAIRRTVAKAAAP